MHRVLKVGSFCQRIRLNNYLIISKVKVLCCSQTESILPHFIHPNEFAPLSSNLNEFAPLSSNLDEFAPLSSRTHSLSGQFWLLQFVAHEALMFLKRVLLWHLFLVFTDWACTQTGWERTQRECRPCSWASGAMPVTAECQEKDRRRVPQHAGRDWRAWERG